MSKEPSTSHLEAIKFRLSNEKERLWNETDPKKALLRTVWVKQAEKELAAEYAFLGIEPPKTLTSEDAAALLAELGL